MSTSIITLFILSVATPLISSANITVNSIEEFQCALRDSCPGDFILLGPANFTGQFVASQNGTEESPITILPIDDKSKIIGTGENGSIGITLNGSFWNLKYFPVVNFEVGIMIINGTGNLLDSLAIQNVSSGILVYSSGNVVTGCAISEATTVGIQVMNNTRNTTLQSNAIQDADPSIVVEEEACCGAVKFNTALGGIEMKGSNFTFEGNVFRGILNVTGCTNTFKEEVDMSPSFTENCTNPDLGGNTFT